jgi:hypothetical protein
MSGLWGKEWHCDRFMAQRVALWQIYGAKGGIMADLWHKDWHYGRFMAQKVAL